MHKAAARSMQPCASSSFVATRCFWDCRIWAEKGPLESCGLFDTVLQNVRERRWGSVVMIVEASRQTGLMKADDIGFTILTNIENI
jgi:hypothetical protein